MEKIDELFEKLKRLKAESINDILKDILIINGAIVQEENYEYKRNIILTLEKKYTESLKELVYEKVKDIVDIKLEENVESNRKNINTKLGTLKMFLIRIAGIKIYKNNKIEKFIEELKREIDTKKVYKIYGELDDELIANI